jgi:ketohexokinase
MGKCIDHIRERYKPSKGETIVSVEVEKPGREGLEDLSIKADYVFYSRSWAMVRDPLELDCFRPRLMSRQNSGSASLSDFLEKQQRFILESASSRARCIFCTWGEEGSGACEIKLGSRPQIVPARLPDGASVVDTIGAGDAFIAAMILQLKDSKELSPELLTGYLDQANRLCGRKIAQEGFANLGPLADESIEN